MNILVCDACRTTSCADGNLTCEDAYRAGFTLLDTVTGQERRA